MSQKCRPPWWTMFSSSWRRRTQSLEIIDRVGVVDLLSLAIANFAVQHADPTQFPENDRQPSKIIYLTSPTTPYFQLIYWPVSQQSHKKFADILEANGLGSHMQIRCLHFRGGTWTDLPCKHEPWSYVICCCGIPISDEPRSYVIFCCGNLPISKLRICIRRAPCNFEILVFPRAVGC